MSDARRAQTLHIAIDAHSIGTGLGGNETYAANLIEALAEVDTSNRYTLYVTRQEAVERYTGRWPHVALRRTLPHTPLIRIPLTLAAELRRRPVDILHVQYTAPPFVPCKVVTMIHDLSFEHLPETFKRRSWMQMRLTVRRTARAAAHVVTDSDFSREDILRTYKLEPERVTTTPLAASSFFKPVEDQEEIRRVREKYGITGDYLLAVGSIQPRKNIPRLIKAYASLWREHALPSLPKLVIAGKRAWLYDETLRAAGDSIARDNIIFTDYVPEADLPALYTGAICFIYPSYFEGFGIPLLEAMRCGTPTITSDRTCFPEVVGDAGLMVDTLDEKAIAGAIMKLLSDEGLRKELRAKGFKRAALFDWRETARLTLAVYERVYSLEFKNTRTR
jgi:glycosyltransferase involved in cell wall biosynthesis